MENASVVWKSNLTSLINATNLAFSSTRYPLNQQFPPGVYSVTVTVAGLRSNALSYTVTPD